MGVFSRTPIRGDVTRDGAEIVQHGGAGSTATAIASALALVFSAISLYETVLRQPELAVYVPPVIHYTRENGGEVFAIPVTISNGGARDGTVLSLELTAKSAAAPESKAFYSAYFVDSGYFLRSRLERGPTGGLQITKQRPKLPFAPLSITGRGNYTGTILFFAKGKEYPLLVSEAGVFDLTLKLNARFDDRLGWLDKVWAPKTQDVTVKVTLARFDQNTVRSGDTLEMKSVGW